jgi:four helix bundle protein
VARLQESFLERIDSFCDRAVDVSDALAEHRISVRVVDQVLASGTSVGANVYEADEAMSFIKCLCIATKELNEFRFWVRLAGRRGWVAATRLGPLEQEAGEIKKILGTMISRSKRR